MEPSASPQMLRGGRARFAEGIAPRITRIYTYEGCGRRRERRAIWVGAGHWQGFEGRWLDLIKINRFYVPKNCKYTIRV